jgi:signal transduction histidine kinase
MHIVTTLEKSANNLTDLLEELLLWARTQNKKIDFKPEIIDISKISRRNVMLLIMAGMKKRINIESKVKSKTFAYADSFMVTTIIRNLVSNAIKFTEKHGEVVIDAETGSHWVTISVSDNGIGISQKDIDKLFRLDVSLSTIGTSREKGSGLGLILCKEFVDMHKGRIWVDSVPGKGSTFSFTLPLTPDMLELKTVEDDIT